MREEMHAAAAKSVQTLNRGYRNQDDFSVVDEEQVGPLRRADGMNTRRCVRLVRVRLRLLQV